MVIDPRCDMIVLNGTKIHMNHTEEKLLSTLASFLNLTAARSLISLGMTTANVDIDNMQPGDNLRLLRELENLVRLCLRDPTEQKHCVHALSDIIRPIKGMTGTSKKCAEVPIITESDVITARGLSWDMCKEIGFSPADQIKLATAVSDLARNIVQFGGRGKIVLTALSGAKPGLEVLARDDGPVVDNVDFVLAKQSRPKIGIGRSLARTKTLVDDLEITSKGRDGTEVTARKYLI